MGRAQRGTDAQQHPVAALLTVPRHRNSLLVRRRLHVAAPGLEAESRVAPAAPPECGALSRLRLRPPSHARPLPRVRDATQTADRGSSSRMKRRFFNLAAALSLVLCVPTAA